MKNPEIDDIYITPRGKVYRVTNAKSFDFLVVCMQTGSSRYLKRVDLKNIHKFKYLGKAKYPFSMGFEYINE